MEHLYDIRAAARIEQQDLFKLQKLKSVPKHFLEKHGGRWQELRFCGIDKVYLGSRGGHLFRRLEQIECKWIVKLRTYSPYGLNEKMSFASYL